MLTSLLKLTVFLLRLALLVFLIGYLPIYCGYVKLGLALLAVSFPVWKVLFYAVRPLGPNWRKARSGSCYTYWHHEFTLVFKGGTTTANLEEVYDRLRKFDDFDGKTNRLARKRGKMVRNARYIYFESQGFFGLLSALINPPLVPVRLWSHRGNRLVVADTADGHMLKGQRRFQAKADGHGGIVVVTEAYDRPRDVFNRLGLRLMGPDIQSEIWTSYFNNIRLYYASRATSTEVAPIRTPRVGLPATSSSSVKWVPLPKYPGEEV